MGPSGSFAVFLFRCCLDSVPWINFPVWWVVFGRESILVCVLACEVLDVLVGFSRVPGFGCFWQWRLEDTKAPGTKYLSIRESKQNKTLSFLNTLHQKKIDPKVAPKATPPSPPKNK